MNNHEAQSKILGDGLEVDYSVVQDGAVNERVGEKDRSEIVKEAIKSEEDFALLEKRLNKEHSELFAKAWAKDKELKEAHAKQELSRNGFADAMPDIADVFPKPEVLQNFLDNGCRWARIFDGDVPPIYQDAFIKGEVLIDSLYEGKVSGIKKLPQLRKILAEREIEQTAI